MMKLELLIFVAFTALICCSEIEDVEQKKRGTGKATNLNSISTEVQKQDYNTYSIYSSNPISQSTSNSYQSQVPNSFYPNHGSSQYYSSSNTQTEAPSYTPQQPQLNLASPATNTQFVPLNFVPSPGYQAKYHVIPSKPNGNIQFAVYQQPSNYPTPIMSYTPQLFSPHATTQINPHQAFNVPTPAGHFNIAQNFPQLTLGGPYLGQPATMVLFHPNLNSPYSNSLYPNPFQNFYNYHPSNAQNKLNSQYASQGVPYEYEKIQSPVPQSIIKEDNDISHSNEYISPSDSNSNYKSTYSSNRNTYTKL